MSTRRRLAAAIGLTIAATAAGISVLVAGEGAAGAQTCPPAVLACPPTTPPTSPPTSPPTTPPPVPKSTTQTVPTTVRGSTTPTTPHPTAPSQTQPQRGQVPTNPPATTPSPNTTRPRRGSTLPTTAEPTTTGPTTATTAPATTDATTAPTTVAPATTAVPVATREFAVDRPAVEPGGQVNATGQGCDPGATVDIEVGGTAAGQTTAGSDGRFATPLALPVLSPGRFAVVARCGPTLDTTIDVVLASRVDTGTSTLAVFLLFVLLALALFRSRRRA